MECNGTPSGSLRARLLPASAWTEAESDWTSIFAASRSRSFFLSGDWVGTWLETYGRDVNAVIVLFDDGAGPVGATILVFRVVWRGFIRMRQLFFHTSGEPDAESVIVEHAAPLSRPDRSDAVLKAVAELVEARKWDEFWLKGITADTHDRLCSKLNRPDEETEWHPSYAVDLADLRAQGIRYEAALSKSTRAQLRRTMALYSERGTPSVSFAATCEEALAWFDELGRLHQRHWEAKGEAGSFASPRWRSFHERLIERAFPRGGVQLAKVSVDGQPIGILYNFVQDKVVFYYQSGFLYEDDNRLRPGLLTHALVIQSYLDQGFERYDFLSSGPLGSRYKASLATETLQLAWTVVRRRTPTSRMFLGARRISQALRKFR